MPNQNTTPAEKKTSFMDKFQEKIFALYNHKYTVRGEKYHLGETAAAYTLLAPTIVCLLVLFVLPLIILLVLSVNDFRVNKGQCVRNKSNR